MNGLGLKHEMDSGFEFNKLSCLFENEDVIAYQHFLTDDNGIGDRVTNVVLLKNERCIERLLSGFLTSIFLKLLKMTVTFEKVVQWGNPLVR